MTRLSQSAAANRLFGTRPASTAARYVGKVVSGPGVVGRCVHCRRDGTLLLSTAFGPRRVPLALAVVRG